MAGKFIVGVDPGINGGLAAINLATGEVVTHPIPTHTVKTGKRSRRVIFVSELIRLIREMVGCGEAVAVIEDVHALPRQGVTSSFRFGEAKGIVVGALAAMGIPVALVSPSKWKRHYRLSSDKRDSVTRALELFPMLKTKNEHCCEAALLAHYGLSVLFRKPPEA